MHGTLRSPVSMLPWLMQGSKLILATSMSKANCTEWTQLLQAIQKATKMQTTWAEPIQKTHGALRGLWEASHPQRETRHLACVVPMQKYKSR